MFATMNIHSVQSVEIQEADELGWQRIVFKTIDSTFTLILFDGYEHLELKPQFVEAVRRVRTNAEVEEDVERLSKISKQRMAGEE